MTPHLIVTPHSCRRSWALCPPAKKMLWRKQSRFVRITIVRPAGCVPLAQQLCTNWGKQRATSVAAAIQFHPRLHRWLHPQYPPFRSKLLQPCAEQQASMRESVPLPRRPRHQSGEAPHCALQATEGFDRSLARASARMYRSRADPDSPNGPRRAGPIQARPRHGREPCLSHGAAAATPASSPWTSPSTARRARP